MAALGLIETRGLVGAVEAADVMLKTADVRLLDKSLAGGGLVTVTVSGEVAAVQASVSAAKEAVTRLPGACLVSAHVIARPDAELQAVTPLTPPSGGREQRDADGSERPTELKISFSPMNVRRAAEKRHDSPEQEESSAPETEEAPPAEEESENGSARDIASLKQLSLGKLRGIAEQLEGLSIPREEIATAGKKRLIDAIANVYRNTEE